LERMPEKPLQELWVALAGPLVNVVISAVLFSWLLFSQTIKPLAELTMTTGPFLERLLLANLFLAAFNLIPAFPMDGGRVLRAVLAMRLEYTRATNIAAAIGQGLALLFGLAGLFGNPMLLFIAFIVWIGASQEAGMVQMKSALAGIPVSRVMLTDFRVIAPTDPFSRAVELILQGSQQDFPVVSEAGVVGLLTRTDLFEALAHAPATTAVSTAMLREFPTSEEGEMLETLFARLQESQCHTVPVLRGETLIGLVTSDNIGEFLMIQTAIKTYKPQAMMHRVQV
ncbi:MAG: CBS domain-containing protein, partial [Holophaga sp.]